MFGGYALLFIVLTFIFVVDILIELRVAINPLVPISMPDACIELAPPTVRFPFVTVNPPDATCNPLFMIVPPLRKAAPNTERVLLAATGVLKLVCVFVIVLLPQLNWPVPDWVRLPFTVMVEVASVEGITVLPPGG